jgi:hypothetical protein
VSLPRSIELEWQKQMIEVWLNTPGIPNNARDELVELLDRVKTEIEEIRCKKDMKNAAS